MSKRASLQMICAVLTAVAATVALLIGWSAPAEEPAAETHANGETTHGKALP